MDDEKFFIYALIALQKWIVKRLSEKKDKKIEEKRNGSFNFRSNEAAEQISKFRDSERRFDFVSSFDEAVNSRNSRDDEIVYSMAHHRGHGEPREVMLDIITLFFPLLAFSATLR